MRLRLACLLAALATLSLLAAVDTKPPTVPRNLVATAVTSRSVSLSWHASSDFKGGSGVAGYDVLRNGAVVGTTAALAYTDAAVASLSTYQYAVRARDNAGNVSVPSVPVSVTTSGTACAQAPGIPTGLAASDATISSITLAWNSVPPPAGCAVTYALYADGSVVVTDLIATSFTVTGLFPETAYSFTVSASDGAGSSAESVAVSSSTLPEGGDSPGFPPRVFAPYVDMLLWPTPSLSARFSPDGARYFSAGFIVAGSGCQATWGRHYAMADGFLIDDIAALRRLGGDVIVSFGGAAGTELAMACSTFEGLKAQYEAVIDTYGLTRLDFDIEGSALGNVAANDLRARAIAALQAAAPADRPLTVQFTLPVLPSGLTAEGVALLENAKSHGVDIGVVNIMAMDYGRRYDPYAMGQHAVSAMNATLGQIRPIFNAKSESDLRAMVGVTPMIGLNDVSPEVFTLEDAGDLVGAAQNAGAGFLGFWSATRDQRCPKRQVVSPTCSGIVQSPGAFTTIFAPFTAK
jgi:chitodextrinase